MEHGHRIERVLMDQEGRERLFRYALLEQRKSGCYGVSVEEEGREACRMPGLTDSREQAAAFLTLLVRGGVGPVGLPDVAEEWKKSASSQ